MSLDRGRRGRGPEGGVPDPSSETRQDRYTGFFRHLRMMAPGCLRVSEPYRAVVSTIARPGPGVRDDPVLLTRGWELQMNDGHYN